MFWVGLIVGLAVGAFLGLFCGGLLAAARRGDDLLAVALAQEQASKATSVSGETLES